MLQLILYASLYGVAVLQQESYRIQSGIALYSSSLKDMVQQGLCEAFKANQTKFSKRLNILSVPTDIFKSQKVF